jgi:hypothetical protein
MKYLAAQQVYVCVCVCVCERERENVQMCTDFDIKSLHIEFPSNKY